MGAWSGHLGNAALITGRATLTLNRPNEFAQALECPNRIYDLGFSETGDPKRSLPVKSSTLWLEIIRRVYSLGVLAVRRESWEVVKSLIFQRPRGLIKSQFWNNWLRHALTMASRSGDLEERQKERKVEVPLLGLCQQTALQMSCLSEDVDQDELLDSIVNSMFTLTLPQSAQALELPAQTITPTFRVITHNALISHLADSLRI